MLLLLVALMGPGALLCLASEPGPNRKSCCPAGAADAPLHLRACCPAEDGQPATSAPVASRLLNVPTSICCAVVPHSVAIPQDRRSISSPIATVNIRLLISVFLI